MGLAHQGGSETAFGSGPGLDQLQHLGADGACPTLAIQSRQNLLGGEIDVTVLSSPLRLGIQCPGPGQHRIAIDG